MKRDSRTLDFVTTGALGGLLAMLVLLVQVAAYAASVKPGDLIAPENAQAIADLVSPATSRWSNRGCG